MAMGPPWDTPSSGNRSRAEVVDHCFEVAHEGVDGEVVDVVLGQPAAPLVVADELAVAGQPDEPVAPHRALPVVVEVGDPVGGSHQRRARADRGVGDPRAVGRRAEVDVLRRPGGTARSGRSPSPDSSSTGAMKRYPRPWTVCTTRWSRPVSPTAWRSCLIRVVKADSDTKSWPQTVSSSSDLVTTRSRCSTRWASTSNTCGSTCTNSSPRRSW